MAYAAADITAAEITGSAADAPLLVGTSVVESAKSNAGFELRWNADGNFATADATETANPVTRSYDRHWHADTRPNSSGTERWLLFKSGTAINFNEFDAAVIMGHNLGANTATLSLQVSDDPDVGTNGTEIATWTPSAPTGNNESRLVSVDLDDAANSNPQAFTAVQYIGVKITAAGGFVPQIGEVWLGKRRQMYKRPRMGYNPDASASRTVTATSLTGVKTRYTKSRSGQVLSAQFVTDTAVAASVVTDLWADTNQGTKPFVWIEEPTTAPATARIMLLDSPVLPGGTYLSGRVRTWDLGMTETGPFFDREG